MIRIFNNTLNNTLGSQPFNSNTNATFETDRNGIANSALFLLSIPLEVSIPSLPISTNARTVSIWVKIPNASVDNHIFFYGDLSANHSYGLSVQSNNLYNFGYANDLVALGYGISGNNWVHVVTTFDGTTAKIYYNGVQKATGNKSAWNTPLSNFKLGGNFGLYVDDLKIYGRALNATEVTSLFTTNTLSSQDFNVNVLKATIYPNPTSDNFTIEMENEVKAVEIYSIQGQKVMNSTSKNIDVSNLSKGMYLVRIEDSNNAIATQKLVVK